MNIYIWYFLLLKLSFAIPLKHIFNGQDKICTNNYADGQISIRSTIRQILGLPKHHALSKEINKWIVPSEYSGFKIIKKQTLKNGIFGLFSDISFNYCYEGELFWSKDIPILKSNFNGLEWNEPICFLQQTHQEIFDKKMALVSEPPQKNQSKLEKFKIWTLDFMKIQQKNALNTYSLKEIARNYPEFLECYKLARRKKYAKQNLDIFLPNQYVGGLFKCVMPLSVKQSIIVNNMDDDLNWLKNKNTSNYMLILCSEENSKPILPLIGDKFENYWTEYNGFNKQNNSVFINISKQVPFLFTPHIIDERSNATNTNQSLKQANSSMLEWAHTWSFKTLDIFRSKTKPKKLWYNEIQINEDYEYNIEEMNKAEKYVSYTLNKLQNWTESGFFKTYNVADDIDQERQRSLSKLLHFPKKILFGTLSIEDKLITILTNSVFKNQLKEIIKENDNKFNIKKK